MHFWHHLQRCIFMECFNQKRSTNLNSKSKTGTYWVTFSFGVQNLDFRFSFKFLALWPIKAYNNWYLNCSVMAHYHLSSSYVIEVKPIETFLTSLPLVTVGYYYDSDFRRNCPTFLVALHFWLLLENCNNCLLLSCLFTMYNSIFAIIISQKQAVF